MQSDLQDALCAWQGGEINDARVAALLERMKSDTAFRAAFAEEIWLLSLARIAQAPSPRWLALCDEIGITVPDQAGSSQECLERNVMETVHRSPLRFVQSWWRAAALGSLAAAAGLALMLVMRPRVEPSNHPADGRSEVAQPVATVLRSSSQHVLRPGSAVLPGRIQFGSGSLTLLFANGASMQLEGPADLDVESITHVTCRVCRLRLVVPKGAEGFSIQTPHGLVKDLGTELGVNVTADGRTRVAVFKGAAEATVWQPGQDARRTQIVRASEAIEMLPKTGQIVKSKFNTDDFLPALPPTIPSLALSTAYRKTILAAKPRHYWPLDHGDERSAPDEAAAGSANTLRLLGNASFAKDANGQTSVALNGAEGENGLSPEAAWLMPGAASAIEFWFLSTSSAQRVTLAALAAGRADDEHVCLIEYNILLNEPGTARVQGPRRLRYMMRWPGNATSGVNVLSPPDIQILRWHHVVAQQRDRQMEFYIDGRLVGRGLSDPLPEVFSAALTFGYCHVKNQKAKVPPIVPSRQLAGRLAQIALYDRALSADEIRAHAAALDTSGKP